MIVSALKAKLASTAVLASIAACPAMPAPAVKVTFVNTPPAYDSKLTSAELGKFHIDTTFSHGASEIFHVGGLTESRIQSGFSLEYKSQQYPDSGETCLWIDKVHVEVRYDPLVRIAKDTPQGTCRYGVTAQHELRHVNTDIITLEAFVPVLKTAVSSITAAITPRKVKTQKEADAAQALFVNVVRTEVERQANEMNRVRAMRQQQIDTRQEYLRLSKACAPPPRKRK